MIEGMNATDIAEYFALVRELEPDVALDGMDHSGNFAPRITEVPINAPVHSFWCTCPLCEDWRNRQKPTLAQLCDQLPKTPTLDEHCARQRAEFANMGKGLLWAVYASICTMGLLYIALKVWEARR